MPFGAGNADPFFQPAQQMEFLVPMRINGTADPESIAWNSFAQRARDALSNDLLETSEPRKVGILARRSTDVDDDDTSEDDTVLTSTTQPAGNVSDLSRSRIIGESDVTKDVNPYFALAGDRVTWTITLRNSTNISQDLVGFDDSIPANLTVISVSASDGTVSVNGQVVVFRLDTLAPNQVVTVEIVTRINPDTAMPFIIDNSLSRDISARVISVSILPSTGETPLWRNRLLSTCLLLMVSGGVWGLRLRKQS